jgi:tRNA (cmo5U34)-methyltransferase
VQESEWGLYRDLGAVVVPRRADQAAALLTLLPFDAGSEFTAVELGCGEGRLTAALLAAFPRARVVALDGDPEMLGIARARLSAYGTRGSVERFELESDEWWPHAEGAGTIVSSLCVHHLDGPGKQTLFRAARRLLAARGALLIADLVEPARPEARTLFADSYDRSAARGPSDLYRRFLDARWNYFRYPDETDMPSGLFEQLKWLEAAGFQDVDCFWLDAGHALYGGYTSGAGAGIGLGAAEAAVAKSFHDRG